MKIIRNVSLRAILLIAPLIFAACQSGHGDDVMHDLPEKGGDWNPVMTVEGHDSHKSDVFQLTGNEAVIQYKTEPVDHHSYSQLQIFLVDGAEDIYDDPVIEVFNNHEVGEIELDNPADNYMLYIRIVNMKYEVKVFEKGGEEPAE